MSTQPTLRVEPVLHTREIQTPLGIMIAIASDRGICLLEFHDRRMLPAQLDIVRRRSSNTIIEGDTPMLARLESELAEYFSGMRREFGVPLDAPGTPFQNRVWAELRRIPLGETRSYAQIAAAIGNPRAVRAAAKANGDNRLAILIPCHRVIGSDGSMTGYAGGVPLKLALLRHEGAPAADQPGSLFAATAR